MKITKHIRQLVEAFVKADIAEKLRTCEIVIVRTDPDGKNVYRKAAKVQ